jgi:hypothetical protein
MFGVWKTQLTADQVDDRGFSGAVGADQPGDTA